MSCLQLDPLISSFLLLLWRRKKLTYLLKGLSSSFSSWWIHSVMNSHLLPKKSVLFLLSQNGRLMMREELMDHLLTKRIPMVRNSNSISDGKREGGLMNKIHTYQSYPKSHFFSSSSTYWREWDFEMHLHSIKQPKWSKQLFSSSSLLRYPSSLLIKRKEIMRRRDELTFRANLNMVSESITSQKKKFGILTVLRYLSCYQRSWREEYTLLTSISGSESKYSTILICPL